MLLSQKMVQETETREKRIQHADKLNQAETISEKAREIQEGLNKHDRIQWVCVCVCLRYVAAFLSPLL